MRSELLAEQRLPFLRAQDALVKLQTVVAICEISQGSIRFRLLALHCAVQHNPDICMDRQQLGGDLRQEMKALVKSLMTEGCNHDRSLLRPV